MDAEETPFWDTIFVKNENIVARKIAGEMLLVPIQSNLADMQRIFALNTVGEFIWNRLDGQKTIADIRGELLDEFDVGQAEVETDMTAFLDELQAANIVSRKEENA